MLDFIYHILIKVLPSQKLRNFINERQCVTLLSKYVNH